MLKCHVPPSWSVCYLISFLHRVAFTKGPQPLVGCYSIFKHHSAESQPPHRPALHTCNKLSSSETPKTSWTKAGQGHFTESHLINIFIFVWLDHQSFYTVNAICLGLSVHTLETLPTLWAYTAALICLLMTDVMQSHFATAVDKICRRLDASHAEPPPYPTAWSANICVWNASEKSADLLIN